MNLSNINDLKSFLGKYAIRLSKSRGQHFLIDREVLKKIIFAADLTKEDTVLEIGPGVGTLTEELAVIAKKVIAVEKDKKLIKPLQSILKNFSNVEIVNEDFLTYQLPSIDYKLVADIPYYITGEILRRLFSASHRPNLILLLVQKEVGERIAAKAGAMSILSVAVQLYSNPEIIQIVPKTSFFPAPAVESALLRLAVSKKPKLNVDQEKFFRLVRIGFSSRRKTLLNNLSAGYKISKHDALTLIIDANLGERVRAQELSIAQWGDLYKLLPENNNLS